MTANELLNKQLEDVTYQLGKILEDVKESDVDFKVSDGSMSMRELLEHLCEVYTAVEEESRGIEHNWGTFAIDDKSWSNLMAQYKTLRAKAIELVSGATDEKGLVSASGYIIGHDFYHIGQLATLRIATDPSWDPYSIYRHG